MSQSPTESQTPFLSGTTHQKRRRGGQPGNTNALKNGLYLAGYRLRNSARVEAHIPDVDDLVEKLKRSIQVTFEARMDSTNLAESTEALRSLSMAVNGLIRLINLSNKSGKSITTPSLEDFSVETFQALLVKYKQLRTDEAKSANSPKTH